MTAAQLADKLLADEHPDVLRESAAWMAAELMEAEVAAQIGAELGQRTPQRLVTCGGTFDATSGHYRSNIIVYATLRS